MVLIQTWQRNQIFIDKQKLKESSTTRLTLQQMLKECQQEGKKGHNWKQENYEWKESLVKANLQ